MSDFEESSREVRARRDDISRKKGKAAYDDLRHKGVISIRTAVVGIIESLENNLGHLWGHGQQEDLTAEQQKNLESWKRLRQEIFDKSEKSQDEFKYHIGRFTISYKETDKKYSYNIRIDR